MPDKILSKKEQDKQERLEYREFIRASVKDGTFFEDAFDWYIFRYVTPLCDRTWLFVVAFASSIITYTLVLMIINSLPIVSKVPVIIPAKDMAVYYPKITALNDSPDIKTIEEPIIKYLVIKYLKDREEYDFSKMNTNDLNTKFEIIKNNSTSNEFKNFKSSISLNNKNSPIRDFGTNVSRKVEIESFSFKRNLSDDFLSKAKNFVYTQVPTQASIAYKLTINSNSGQVTQTRYVADISFKFSNINNKSLDNDLEFSVSDYKLFINNKPVKE